jgi:hypothetical protein
MSSKEAVGFAIYPSLLPVMILQVCRYTYLHGIKYYDRRHTAV